MEFALKHHDLNYHEINWILRMLYGQLRYFEIKVVFLAISLQLTNWKLHSKSYNPMDHECAMDIRRNCVEIRKEVS